MLKKSKIPQRNMRHLATMMLTRFVRWRDIISECDTCFSCLQPGLVQNAAYPRLAAGSNEAAVRPGSVRGAPWPDRYDLSAMTVETFRRR
jgi:hypothetical protein